MKTWKWEIGLVGIAISLRVLAVLVLQSHLVPNSTYEHGTIAANLLQGKGFTTNFLGAEGPTSQQAPVYPVVVASAYAVAGVGSPKALLLLELSQALAGGLLVLGTLVLGREIAPHRIWLARSSAFLVAVSPTLIYATTHVQVVSIATCGLVWTLALAYRTGRTKSETDAAKTGLSLGLLSLCDPILGLVAPGIVLTIGSNSSIKKSFLNLNIVALVAIAVIAPWTIRNYKVHGEFVAIKSSFGYAFWQGNNALSRGTDKVVRPSVETALDQSAADLIAMNRTLWEARHIAGYIDDVALTKADYEQLSKVSEPERSRILYRRAIADLKAQPGRYRQLCLSRLRAFVFFDETNPKTRTLAYRLPHLGLTLFAVIGLLTMPHKLRTRLLPTFLTAILITLFHTLTIVSARFHIPIEPLMALWGCAGLAWLPSLAPGRHYVERVRVARRRLGVALKLGSV